MPKEEQTEKIEKKIQEEQTEKPKKGVKVKEKKPEIKKESEYQGDPVNEKKIQEGSVKKEKKERLGVLNIYTTFNNTVINLTDLSGTSVAKFSGGGSTKQSRLKANPTIAMFVAQKIAEEAKDNGFTGFYVKIRAGTGQTNPGPGAHAAIKSLTRAGFKIISIIDSTRIARGGPKKKGGRRGRRP